MTCMTVSPSLSWPRTPIWKSFRRAHAAGNEEKAARDLEQGLRYLKDAVLESRRLVNGLRTLALDDLGLAGALEEAVAEEKAAGWVGGRRLCAQYRGTPVR